MQVPFDATPAKKGVPIVVEPFQAGFGRLQDLPYLGFEKLIKNFHISTIIKYVIVKVKFLTLYVHRIN